jgi:hypothetical protein
MFQNLPFASQCELKPIPLSELKAPTSSQSFEASLSVAALQSQAQLAFGYPSSMDMSLPPPGYAQLMSGLPGLMKDDTQESLNQ